MSQQLFAHSEPAPAGFDHERWRRAETHGTDLPWQAVAAHVQQSSAGRPWRGLAVWHQVGPAGDLYVPAHGQHSIIVRRGTPTFLVQRRHGQTRSATWQPGEVVMVPAGTTSFWRNPQLRDDVHINVDPAWLQRVGGNGRVLPDCFGRSDPFLRALADMLLASLDTNTSLRPNFGDDMAHVLAVHLLEHYVAPAAPCTAGLSRRQMDRVRDAVAAALHEPWPLQRMADVVELSPYHFARSFKVAFGMPPHAYLCAQRMAGAARLVRGTGRPMAEIAAALGYTSTGAFAQAFRRHWGVTPATYRRDR